MKEQRMNTFVKGVYIHIVYCRTKSFHQRIGVQHSPLDPLHRVLTADGLGRGCHSGVVFHQAARRPCLEQRESLTDQQQLKKIFLKI